MNSSDSERRSRLLSLKLRALIRDHLGLEADPEGTPEVFALGAAFIADNAVWILVDGEATRALGAATAWALRFNKPMHVLVERDSGVLARRAELLSLDITIWHVNDRQLLPAVAEPHLEDTPALPEHVAFIELITSAGADAVIEHGVVVGEVRGLEMCRAITDEYTGESRLEVGMGAHDREAFAMVHGGLPTEQALKQVIDAVVPHRTEGADQHPLNQFGAERLYRWRALQNPTSVGFASLELCDPPVKRTNIKDGVPCVARGVTTDGNESVAVFVNGVDLELVPFALDAASREGVNEVVIVARERDITPSMKKISEYSTIPVRFVYL